MGEPVDDEPPGTGDTRGASGNRARDHLANERTYLSWLRTSLGVLALAVAVARFGGNTPRDTAAVAGLAVLGLLILGVGTQRYYQVSVDLERDRFTLSRRGPLVVAVVVVVVAAVFLPILSRG